MNSAVGNSLLRALPSGVGSSRILRVLMLAALLLIGLIGPSAVGAQGTPSVAPQYLAPTLPGAPFLPVEDRTEHILNRYESLTALSELEQAQKALSDRSIEGSGPEFSLQRSLSNSVSGAATVDPAPDLDALAETQRILDAQISSLERSLEALAATEESLLEETEEFGIGLAIFPVDEVRKPFWDDWGQPRSGGRRHAGTDVLAQIGVPLRAIEDGVVETVSAGGLGGNGIFMIGDSGSRYFFTHMDELADLEPGDRVLAGQPVGTVGDTGNARGAPHLHMQWDPSGGADWQNPFPMLDVLFGEGRTAEFADTAQELLLAEAEDLANADAANS